MAASGPVVRDALPGDATACAAVYAPYVTGTAVTSATERRASLSVR